ncbi:MAG: cell division protein FtsQ/DivIB [Pyrinomonadaceae bacterium]
MREQVIAQKVGNRSGTGEKRWSGGVAQRPVRRDRDGSGASFAARLRGMLSYVPLVLKLVIAIAIGALIFTGYRTAASASFFQLRTVELQGNSRASAEQIQTLVKRDVVRIGVWKADLNDIAARLERLPWVRRAVVSRVLPDGIRVRLLEREPVAVIRTTAGRLYWVDVDAVLLGQMMPTDQMPAFFLRGWNEEESDAARKGNCERVEKFLDLQREWGAAGVSERVSEVNLVDLRDVRTQLAGDDSQIEVRLGSTDHGKRLKQGLDVLDEQRQTPRGPFISYVDLTQGKHAIVGFLSGAHTIKGVGDATPGSPDIEPTRNTNGATRSEGNNRDSTNHAARRGKNKEDRRDRTQRNQENGGERPRRILPAQ